MSHKFSLHLGVNRVDKTKYNSKFRALKKAEADTSWYYDLARQCGFEATLLLGEQGTATTLLEEITTTANKMKPGDLFFLTWSGHGARVKDTDADEKTKYDQLLVLYDRFMIDDELKKNWILFPPGAGIFFLTDSCYNGTVSRLYVTKRFSENTGKPGIVSRNDPDFTKNRATFTEAGRVAKETQPQCSILHIASCGDNQLANEGPDDTMSSVFTTQFKKQYREGDFSGTYRQFYDQLLMAMPSTQTPNWDTGAGADSTSFEKRQFLEF